MTLSESYGHEENLSKAIASSESFEELLNTCGIDAHHHTCVGYALMEKQLKQGKHLTHCCRNWKAVYKMESGGTVAT